MSADSSVTTALNPPFRRCSSLSPEWECCRLLRLLHRHRLRHRRHSRRRQRRRRRRRRPPRRRRCRQCRRRGRRCLRCKSREVAGEGASQGIDNQSVTWDDFSIIDRELGRHLRVVRELEFRGERTYRMSCRSVGAAVAAETREEVSERTSGKEEGECRRQKSYDSSPSLPFRQITLQTHFPQRVTLHHILLCKPLMTVSRAQSGLVQNSLVSEGCGSES